jgi:3-phenylpropionate/trans-cinnamate dioxygenase ferredoxin reductase subunit
MSGATSTSTIAIVGASLGGAKAAEGAREAGFEGRIVLVGEEDGAPYERPPLSKDVLRGDKEPDSARVHPEDFYDEHRIERITDRVTGLDTAGRTIELAGGESIGFDQAVLATGAAPRRLRAPGAELAGIHLLRTVADSLRLREAIRGASRVAVVGAGWIGSEVAASARQMGAEVVIIDPAPVPLQRVLGDEVGAMFSALHRDHGVALRLGTGVTALRGGDAVEAVVLDDGQEEPADVVVVGIGVVPRTELAEAAGLKVDDGVVVDEHLESSVPGIYAAGDVASAWHPFYERRLRVEHWANALNQGLAAGRSAAGQRAPYDRLPYFFSDQYDLGMEYVGYGAPDDDVVVRGDLAEREAIVFWLRDGLVTAAMNVNVWDVTDDLKAIIEARRPVDAADLADPDVALSSLASP